MHFPPNFIVNNGTKASLLNSHLPLFGFTADQLICNRTKGMRTRRGA